MDHGMKTTTPEREADSREYRAVVRYDYILQVWTRDGVVLPCSHPKAMRAGGKLCCNSERYKGQRLSEYVEYKPKGVGA